MDHLNLETLKRFDIDSLPNLDVVTLGALELLYTAQLPNFDFRSYKRPLVVGSGNAGVTGRILFEEMDAVYADEGTYREKLKSIPDIDGAVLISASGGKHAVSIAEDLKSCDMPLSLFTNNSEAPAKEFVRDEQTLVFPKNREPYTYNTSTYLSMIFSKTKEDPQTIHNFLMDEVKEQIPNNFVDYDAFYLLVPPQFNGVREMFMTKFDELFGSIVSGRVFTMEQTKHAKTVVPSEKELFISFGVENTLFGSESNRLHIPLPKGADYGAMVAIGYYVIGHIEKQHPPYFKKNIVAYTKQATETFGQIISPIVE